ncbi:MAG: GMC family oxidoreductase [Spirochaetales bacterium]|nr:GMC family oxidoreductase [Spirochaetales bacterium]
MEASIYDYVIVGSGFGGSVSALRLAQKGYSVAVIESGKRFADEDFPRTNWNMRKFFWFPKLFCYGIQRINLIRDVMILSGAGVGGGSLVYANTLYVPPERFFQSDIMKRLGGSRAMKPFYELAQKMLGVTTNIHISQIDHEMRATAETFGRGHTFAPTPVGVYFGKNGKTEADPYFSGEGPERTGCNFCGGCMVGCRHNAKNTLVKNYLYFAEKLGATILPERKVVDVIPVDESGAGGYRIKTMKTTGFLGKPGLTLQARNLVVSAGVLGSLSLLMKLKSSGRLPRLSDALGSFVRTNSEAILGVTVKSKEADFSQGIAITSSVFPEEHTHIEPVRYSRGSDAMGTLATILTDGGGKIPRQLRFLWNILKNPLNFLRTLSPVGFARQTIILLVMQTLDNSLKLVRKRRLIWPFSPSLTSVGGGGVPTYIPVAQEFARRLAARLGGIPRSAYNEVLLDVPTTAHILGGCIMSESPDQGVIDLQNRVHGYPNILVCDGSMIPGNLGVNPSLSITAFTERAMSLIPPRKGAELKPFNFEKKWKVTGLISGSTKESRVKQPSRRR